MDRAALDPLVLETVDQVIGPGAQFSLTQATQIHPGPGRPAPALRAGHLSAAARPRRDGVHDLGLWHAGGANTSVRPRLGVIIDYVQPWP
jgi:hypothetical protein